MGSGGDEGDGEGVEGDVVVLGGVRGAEGEGAEVVEGAGWWIGGVEFFVGLYD